MYWGIPKKFIVWHSLTCHIKGCRCDAVLIVIVVRWSKNNNQAKQDISQFVGFELWIFHLGPVNWICHNNMDIKLSKIKSVVWYAVSGYCFTHWELIVPVCLWYSMPHTSCRPALFVSHISRYTTLVMYASSLLFTFILISKCDKTPLEERFILTLL